MSIKPVTFTEDEMAHELHARAAAMGIKTISIANLGELMDVFEDIVIAKLAEGQEVKMRNFGTFEVRIQQARRRWNPQTKQHEDYPEKRVPKFDASDIFRDTVENTVPTAVAETTEGATEGSSDGDNLGTTDDFNEALSE